MATLRSTAPGLFALLAALALVASSVTVASAAGDRDKKVRRHLHMAEYLRLHENDPAAAALEYKKVLRLDRGHIVAAAALAECELAAGRPKQAVKALESLARRHKANPMVWSMLGDMRRQTGDRESALKAYERALKVQPGHVRSLAARAELSLEAYKEGHMGPEETKSRIDAYLAREGQRQTPRFMRLWRARVEMTGDEAAVMELDAVSDYEAAWEERSAKAIQRRMERARRGLEKCVETDPSRQRCFHYLGLVHSSVKAGGHYDLDKARSYLEKAPDLPEAQVELAVIDRKLDEMGQAEARLLEVLKKDPDHQRAKLELGILYKLDGKNGEATQAFIHAYEMGRGSSFGARALEELAYLEPKHQLVVSSLKFGAPAGSDVLSTERFRGAVELLERRFGGVEADAREVPVLGQMLQRIVEAADIDPAQPFRVAVLGSSQINAFALPNGHIYFTRGFFDFMAKAFPDRPIDQHHDVVAHVLAHEMVHVISGHTLRTQVYKAAVADAKQPLSPAVLTEVTRIHEMEADREGIVMAFLAGYHPRGGIAFLEARGRQGEIPAHLDHPTYDERIRYLEEYWSNEVRYAWMSFSFGLEALEEARELEASDPAGAARGYNKSIEHFKRFGQVLKPTREILNNMGIAYAKLGLLELPSGASPLHRWMTPFSVEQQLAVQYVSVRERIAATTGSTTRSIDKKPETLLDGQVQIPWQLDQASSLFREAVARRQGYSRSWLNLATVQLAVGDVAGAEQTVSQLPAGASAQDLTWIGNLRAVLAAETGKLDAAIVGFRKALAAPGAQKAARYNLATALHKAGKGGEAKSTYEAFLAAHPKGPWAAAARRALTTL